jgi:hypothetical protein
MLACILGAVIATLILRSDFGNISRTAAVEAVRQVSAGSSTAVNMMSASHGTTAMMDGSDGMMSMMMSGMMGAAKNGMMSGATAMMGSGKHSMMSPSMMSHAAGSMMGSGTSTGPGTMMGQGSGSMMGAASNAGVR